MDRAEVISIKYLGRLTTEQDRRDLERDIRSAIAVAVEFEQAIQALRLNKPPEAA